MTIKRSILGSMIVLLSMVSVTTAYFEDRYFCESKNSSITVSMGTGSQLCFVVLAELQREIDDVTKELQAVERHLEVGRDPIYRGEVQTTLQKKLDQLIQWQTYMKIVIEDYEKDLFIRVKSIVSFYVKPVYEQIMTKIQQADLLMARTMMLGNPEQYRYITDNMQEYYYMNGVIERIKEASTFDELLPFVKIFVGQRAPTVDTGVLIIDAADSSKHGVSAQETGDDTKNNQDGVGATGDAVLSGSVFLPRNGSRK